MEAARRRLPKVAPTGRAGVRALRGPVRWSERREAPIQCGFAQTYEAELGVALLAAPSPFARRMEYRCNRLRLPIGYPSNRTPRSGEGSTRMRCVRALP